MHRETAAGPGGMPSGILFGAIFLVAFATLLLEVSLTRVLSFTIWYHFSYVVICTALLGIGASGTLLAIRPDIAARRPRPVLARCAALAAMSAVGLLGLIYVLPLDPMAIFTDPRQAAALVAYQLAAATPFFFSGLAVAIALRESAARVDRLYFWDLVGAGLGCGSAVTIMDVVSPPGTVVVAAAALLCASAVFAGGRRARWLAGAVAAALVLAAKPAERIPFTIAPSKELAVLTRTYGMQPRFTRWKAVFRTDVVENPRTEADPSCMLIDWGLSAVGSEHCEPARFFFNHDGTAGAAMYDLSRHPRLDHLDFHILRFPYLVATPNPRVLVIGVGGGRDVVTAHQYGASQVTGVELDPVEVGLLRDGLEGATRGFFHRPDIRLVAGEGRHFIRASGEAFDLIQITGVDTLSAQFSGSYVLAENYLYTVEAFRDYFDHLKPGGTLSIGAGDLSMEEPRSTGRMVSVAQRALRERGIPDPARHIAVVYGRLLNEVLVRPDGFQPAQIERLAAEAARLGFKPALLPGRDGNAVFEALASDEHPERDGVLARLPYRLSPTTDDSPFFFSFFRWGRLLDATMLQPTQSSALGQIVLLGLLSSLTVLGCLLIAGPLIVFRRRGIVEAGRSAIGVLVYFLAIGAGFMLLEISLLQRFVIFLGYPTYSLSVTLFGLLVFLGAGSFLSRKWMGREAVALPAAVLLLALFLLGYVKGVPLAQDRLLGAPLAVRVLVTIAGLAPLGIVLGLFFPLGIRRAAAIHPDLVPWAWAINGCASVTAGVLAVILAMNYGFTRVWGLSLVLYALGVATFLAARPRQLT